MTVGIFEFAIDKSVDPAIIAKRTEELGFASYWVPDHPIIPIHRVRSPEMTHLLVENGIIV